MAERVEERVKITAVKMVETEVPEVCILSSTEKLETLIAGKLIGSGGRGSPGTLQLFTATTSSTYRKNNRR